MSRLIDADALKEDMKRKRIFVDPEAIERISVYTLLEHIIKKTKALMIDAVTLAPKVEAIPKEELQELLIMLNKEQALAMKEMERALVDNTFQFYEAKGYMRGVIVASEIVDAVVRKKVE